MDMLKALVFGGILTALVAGLVGSQGSSGGALQVHSMALVDYKVFWSWPLFLSGSGLSWALMLLQR